MVFKTELNSLKKEIGNNISNDLLVAILFEMGRYFDKKFVIEVKDLQKKNGRVFNQNERKLLRQYYYYQTEGILKELDILNFTSICYNNEDVLYIVNDCIERCKKYSKEKIISSIKERQHNIEKGVTVNNSTKWLKYYKDKVSNNYHYSSFILNITQEDFISNNYSFDNYYNIISSMYADLENYRHLFIVIDGIITDKQHIDITWKLIYKLGVFCENFVKYKEIFNPFKKEQSIKELLFFLNDRFPGKDNTKLVKTFYSSISTGLK